MTANYKNQFFYENQKVHWSPRTWRRGHSKRAGVKKRQKLT